MLKIMLFWCRCVGFMANGGGGRGMGQGDVESPRLMSSDLQCKIVMGF
jgi:hypothetical protein